MKNILLIICLLFFIRSMQAQDKGNVLIKNGTVLTITKGTLEATDVLVRDGKILQIGKNISTPSGFTVIDATGLFVMPGIIDAHSHAGIDAVNEATNPVNGRSKCW